MEAQRSPRFRVGSILLNTVFVTGWWNGMEEEIVVTLNETRARQAEKIAC
jgi:hypothetical protein